jgi:hypothetical protein
MDARTREPRHDSGLEHEDPNIIWFAEECAANHVRLDALVRYAERLRDVELAAFFRRAQAVGQRLAVARAGRTRPLAG